MATITKRAKLDPKVLNPSVLEEGEPPQPKRQKISAYERQCRMKELNEEISGLNRHIRIKEQRLEQANASRNFKVCDEVAGEISELKSQWWELNTGLVRLQQKSKKAVQYQNRKKNAALRREDDDNIIHSGDPNFSPSLPTPHM